MMAQAAQYKKDIVKKIRDLSSQNPIIGAVNVEGLPAPQFQKIREQLRGKVTVFMAKKRFIKLALDEIEKEKGGIKGLEGHIKGMPALIFTSENPFSLFNNLKKNKSSAPAKGGQVAPKDIVVPAGPTGFSPGPVIGELGSLGIKTSVQNGKIAIIKDTVVCKEGAVISDKLAGILTRLGIQPMEIGLTVTAIYENGAIFTKDVLDIDEERFMSDLQNAARWAVNLSVEAGFPTKDTIEIMLIKASREAKAIGVEANIFADDIMPLLLAKANSQMMGVKNAAKM